MYPSSHTLSLALHCNVPRDAIPIFFLVSGQLLSLVVPCALMLFGHIPLIPMQKRNKNASITIREWGAQRTTKDSTHDVGHPCCLVSLFSFLSLSLSFFVLPLLPRSSSSSLPSFLLHPPPFPFPLFVSVPSLAFLSLSAKQIQPAYFTFYISFPLYIQFCFSSFLSFFFFHFDFPLSHLLAALLFSRSVITPNPSLILLVTPLTQDRQSTNPQTHKPANPQSLNNQILD